LVYLPKRRKLKRKNKRNEFEKAKETAFQLLSFRPRSAEELKRKLIKKGFSYLAIKRAIERVKELGYLDDRDYAYMFACSSIENKHWGPLRIQDALVKKGISQEIIKQTIAKIKEEYDISQVACSTLDSKFADLRFHQKPDKKTRNKAINYLRRKGFSWNTIFSIVKSIDD